MILNNLPNTAELVSGHSEADILDLSNNTLLEKLIISDLTNLTQIIWPTNAEIKSIVLTWCTQLQHLDLSGLTHLTELKLENCNELTQITFAKSSTLESFERRRCRQLTMDNLESQAQLQKIVIDEFDLLGAPVIDLSEYKHLKKFSIMLIESAMDTTVLPQSASLSLLHLYGVHLQQPISEMELPKLYDLELGGITIEYGYPEELSFNGQQPLEILKLYYFTELKNISFSGIKRLFTFEVRDCGKLKSIDGYQEIEIAQSKIRSCPNLAV